MLQQNNLCSFPKQTIQYHSNPSLCPTSNAEEAEVEQFYGDLQDLLELTPKKDNSTPSYRIPLSGLRELKQIEHTQDQ